MNISKTWDVDPTNFAQVVQEDIVNLTMNVAEEIFDGVVSRTPVFTGDLRASWVASASENSAVVTGGTVDATLPPPVFPADLRRAKPHVIYIMNSTPYAGLVEFGGPTNPPRAMVQKTLSSL